MAQKRLTIDYQEYASMAEMEEADRTLLERAVEATEGSYAPYSKYNVGAAVLLSDGTVVTGANQENAAFPSGLCAERTALFAAHAQYPRLPCHRGRPQPYCSIFLCRGYSAVYFQRTIGKRGRKLRNSPR